jgi:hypothetical protein
LQFSSEGIFVGSGKITYLQKCKRWFGSSSKRPELAVRLMLNFSAAVTCLLPGGTVSLCQVLKDFPDTKKQ